MATIVPITNKCNQNCLFCSAKDRKDNIQLLYLGNFIESKGVFDCIKAMKFLKDTNCELTCGGKFRDKEFEEEVKEYIRTYKLPVTLKESVFGESKFQLYKN